MQLGRRDAFPSDAKGEIYLGIPERKKHFTSWCQGSCGRWPRGQPGGRRRARVRPWKQGVQRSWGHSPAMLAPQGPPAPRVPALPPRQHP